uniref:Uncharacterized protein n=1 Tax=Timema douglasi TaxID=61478 RepID=A0A7R8VAV7_TIMDO|nr:unnamed protein product [Timema douglasi]
MVSSGPPLLARVFHAFPHLNISLHLVNSTFDPRSTVYLEASLPITTPQHIGLSSAWAFVNYQPATTSLISTPTTELRIRAILARRSTSNCQCDLNSHY